MCRLQTASWQRAVEWPAERGGCESGSESQVVGVALGQFGAVEWPAFPIDLVPESEPVVEHPTP